VRTCVLKRDIYIEKMVCRLSERERERGRYTQRVVNRYAQFCSEKKRREMEIQLFPIEYAQVR
jgi:hypothetical protein